MSSLRDYYTTITNTFVPVETFEERITARGLRWSFNTFVEGLLDLSNHSIYLQTGDKNILSLGIKVEKNQARVDQEFWENVTTATGAAPLAVAPFNANRNSALMLDAVALVGNVTAHDGNKIFGPAPEFGTGGVGTTTGAGTSDITGNIVWLKPNTGYLFKVTNNSGVATDLSITMRLAEGKADNI